MIPHDVMLFDEALQYLLSLGHETLAIKLGLANTERLLESLGRPQDAFPKVQIAGTNGKGSTAAMLEAICLAAHIKAGLYTSPHLVHITERIRIAGREITREDFARLTTRVRAVAQALVGAGQLATLPTFFEQLTAIALLAFREARVRLAILETGLGGRLDATTAARAETVCITPVALDHQEYLGLTLAEIAAEKAAIIRPGVTAIVAPQPTPALEVILERCAACDVSPRLGEWQAEITGAEEMGRLRVNFETAQDRYSDVLLALRGRHQITNAGATIRLAESLRERGHKIARADIIAGLENARHAGRLELWESLPRLLFDGAHNAAGARALREFLDQFIAMPVTLVFGAMRDKDLALIASQLFPAAHRLILTQPQNPRAATPEALREVVPSGLDSSKITLAANLRRALRAAREQTSPAGLICITGSLYLVGEAQAILQAEHASRLQQDI
jgi:dihydrofolate synthase/folylpolyglutamate synthase